MQLHAVLADVDANLAACESAVEKAPGDDAQIVMLPEFFTTGVAHRLDIGNAAQPMDGPATGALTGWAARHGLLISGSLLIRDEDGHIRNPQLFITGQGIVARHDKDLPTMWEDALYTGPDATVRALGTPQPPACQHAPGVFARAVGAPVVHAAHLG